jgi:hypothetical protein
VAVSVSAVQRELGQQCLASCAGLPQHTIQFRLHLSDPMDLDVERGSQRGGLCPLLLERGHHLSERGRC